MYPNRSAREAALSEATDHVTQVRRGSRWNPQKGLGSRSTVQPNVGKSPPCRAKRSAWRRVQTGSDSRICTKRSAPFRISPSRKITVRRHSGFVAHRREQSVVLFGYPAAHEHDAERAIDAGLELCAAVRTLRPDADVPMRCRVGIATGMVIVGALAGAAEVREHGIVGDAPDLAGRLQLSAQPDTVTIEPTTWRLIGNLFDCRDLGALDTNSDTEPICRWQVLV